MLTRDEIVAAAAALDGAERSRTPIRALSLLHPGMAIADAYAVQRAWVEHKLSAGRRIIGHKIGLTSKAMQNAVGIAEPDSGALLDDMRYEDSARIPTSRFIAPRVEVELAFILKDRLAGPGCSLFDVLRATEYVVPALEILDARMHRVDPETSATRKVTDTISDNAANAAIVLGNRPFRPHDTDLRWVSAILFRNAEVEETGVAAGVLNNPANGIAWLADRLAHQDIALEPGQIILAGSFTRPVDAKAGDVFHADYGPFGSVGCQFV
jgi:2-oxo-hept-3-ene-1,7-dioate hydratase